MSERVILHCDLNNFFASVSLLSNVTLYDMPVAVCGSVEARHGIVLAKNEIAKKCGVKTAEAIWEAKAKCPDLVTLPPDYKKYNEYSLKARRIYERYTDLIEPFGIDECWLDVTGSVRVFGTGEEIAHRIRREIKAELGITISVGVSFNKVFAKLGSDMKKPDAVTVISRENFREKVWGLPASDLLFIGKNTAAKLRNSGVFTIGDIAACDEAMLNRLLGKNGVMLRTYALGEDISPVTPPKEEDMPKSIGRSVTPDHDIKDNEEVWKIFLEISEDISRQLHAKDLYATCVQVHTRDISLNIKEFGKTFSTPSNISMILAKRALQIFKENYMWSLPLRSVGFRVTNLKNENIAIQQDMFSDINEDKKAEIIEDSILTLRQKFGQNSIKRGRNVD